MISVMWRALVAIAGFAVVAAATHVNVMHRGGYGAIDSWLVIAVSVLLAVGMGFVGTEWQSNSKFGAVVLFVCLLAGEARTRIVAACHHRPPRQREGACVAFPADRPAPRSGRDRIAAAAAQKLSGMVPSAIRRSTDA